MRVVVLSAAAIALVGAAGSAQEAGQPSASDSVVPQSSAAARPAALPRWTELAPGQSSLLSQLNAVIRARRAEVLDDASLPENVVHLTSAVNDEIVTPAEDCRLMPSPGSRIFTERCFTETSSEKRLNEYQFDEELRFSRQEALRRQMEDALRAQEAARRAAGNR